ncbi:MAG: branched-chain amino acid transaminase [Candidatus Aenigmarchaeota archaeon]|nr:branched-chain amino acid transaminase [Candidatus Aenigmarchaeota archaeon]
MEKPKSDFVWMNGKFIKWQDSNVHITTHALHYGSSIFEGIRCYNTKNGSAVFKLKEHVKRFFESAKIYRMEIPYSKEEIQKAITETIKKNNLKECYIRPLAYKNDEGMGLNPLNICVDVAIMVWYWGSYLGDGAIDVKVSSWNRMAPNTFPALAKAGGNYINSQLAKMDAVINGYDEAIMLNTNGFVTEGSGENLFLIKDGTIYTPALSDSVLKGITRASVMCIAKEMGYILKEETIPREMLYIADELFFTGTAAEIAPIKSVDKIKIGNGKTGPVTQKIKDKFLSILKTGEPKEWFGFV